MPINAKDEIVLAWVPRSKKRIKRKNEEITRNNASDYLKEGANKQKGSLISSVGRGGFRANAGAPVGNDNQFAR